MRHRIETLGLAGVVICGAVGLAQGQTVIDFDSFTGPVTNQFAEATFSTVAGQENISFAFSSNNTAPNILCTADIGGTQNCINPTFIDFTDPVNDLSFWAIETNEVGVTAQFAVFENGAFSASVDLNSVGGASNNQFVDLSAFSNVTRLEITVNAGLESSGIGWDTFRFTVVPAPSSVALLSVGMLAAVRRRR